MALFFDTRQDYKHRVEYILGDAVMVSNLEKIVEDTTNPACLAHRLLVSEPDRSFRGRGNTLPR
jgi:hypothetical protein